MNKFDSMTDEQIALLASNDDCDAIDYLLDKYRSFVRVIARSYFLIGADREDIIQEGMIGLFKAIRDYRAGEDTVFSTFAHMCVKRQIISAIKAATRKKHLPLNSYVSLDKVIYDDEQETTLLNTLTDNVELSPEDIVISKESSKITMDMISSYLSEYETCVLSKYLEGKPYSDIAISLGKTEKSIDNALQRIKKKIEKNLKETYNKQ